MIQDEFNTEWLLLGYEPHTETVETPVTVGFPRAGWGTGAGAAEPVELRLSRPGLPPALVSPGKPAHGTPRLSNHTVTVNGEERGPEWGKGEAGRDFDRLRAEVERIPRGQRVAHELSQVITPLGRELLRQHLKNVA